MRKAIKLIAVSALAIAVTLARVDMANACYQNLDASIAAENSGRDKADKDEDRDKGRANRDVKADTKGDGKANADAKVNGQACSTTCTPAALCISM